MTSERTVRSESDWADDPRRLVSEDEFGRATFVDLVAARLNAKPEERPSTVFGLVGPWGRGKTSLLHMVRDRLAPDWRVVDFSPWAATDASGTTAEFVRSLAGALDLEPGRASRKAKRRLIRYARFGTPLLGVIPFWGAQIEAMATLGLDRMSTVDRLG